ncbi:MAG: DoxX family protein [Chitinophagaceae bacterium]|nr:MAG: DoxX family protein [Chitinophagaceae bacterium]
MNKEQVIIKLFLRFAIAAGFLSAVGDRFGLWHYRLAWGNWNNFEKYVSVLNPWAPQLLIPVLSLLSTVAEILFALCLLIGFKTSLFARLSGLLLLIFALSMTFTTGIKTAFDASVFTASAGAFSLGLIQEKWLEIDSLIM